MRYYNNLTYIVIQVTEVAPSDNPQIYDYKWILEVKLYNVKDTFHQELWAGQTTN